MGQEQSTNAAPRRRESISGVRTLDDTHIFPAYPEYTLNPDDVPHVRNLVSLSDWIYYYSKSTGSVEPETHTSIFERLWKLMDKLGGAEERSSGVGEFEFRQNYFHLQHFADVDEYRDELVCWALVVCKEFQTCYIVFRGTTSIQDLLTDLCSVPFPDPEQKLFAADQLHAGLAALVQAAYPPILAQLTKLAMENEGTNFKLYITGHSSGGGLAQVFWKHYQLRQHDSFQFQKCITFAAPLVKWTKLEDEDITFFREAAAKRQQGKYFPVPKHLTCLSGYDLCDQTINFVNSNDMIPCLPFAFKFGTGQKTYSKTQLSEHPLARASVSLIESVVTPIVTKKTPNIVLGYRPLGHTIRIAGELPSGSTWSINKKAAKAKEAARLVNALKLEDMSQDFSWFMHERYFDADQHQVDDYVHKVIVVAK